MAVIDKSVTNIYNNCSSPELITAIEKLTQAVKDLKPVPNDELPPEMDKVYTDIQAAKKDLEETF